MEGGGGRTADALDYAGEHVVEDSLDIFFKADMDLMTKENGRQGRRFGPRLRGAVVSSASRGDDTLSSLIPTLASTGFETQVCHHGCSKSIPSYSQTIVPPSKCQWLKNERSISRTRNHDSRHIDSAIGRHTGP